MRMGEFVNAAESVKITDNIFSDKDGIESMKSIKPNLGKGLGQLKDNIRGKTFPQFKFKNKKNLDDKFSIRPILVLSSKAKKKINSKINLVESKNISGLDAYLKNINSKAIIVRPDRFILSSLDSLKNFRKFIKENFSLLT